MKNKEKRFFYHTIQGRDIIMEMMSYQVKDDESIEICCKVINCESDGNLMWFDSCELQEVDPVTKEDVPGRFDLDGFVEYWSE